VVDARRRPRLLVRAEDQLDIVTFEGDAAGVVDDDQAGIGTPWRFTGVVSSDAALPGELVAFLAVPDAAGRGADPTSSCGLDAVVVPGQRYRVRGVRGDDGLHVNFCGGKIVELAAEPEARAVPASPPSTPSGTGAPVLLPALGAVAAVSLLVAASAARRRRRRS
jgi:hypothetical protein